MGTMRDLWLRWKMMKLPWRKTFLIGQDLSGNTFWEFKDNLASNRMRRIVRSRKRGIPLSDVSVSPQWHQWLRHTRYDPPTIQEQHGDLARLAQLQYNARLADERWAAKPRYIEKPKPRKTLGGSDEVAPGQETIRGGNAPKTEPEHKEGVRSGVETQLPRKAKKENPWAQGDAGSKPGAGWQPEAWTPGPSKRKS